jgi:hypothetical protein
MVTSESNNMPPPDAAEGPGKGPQQSGYDDQLDADRTSHHAENCRTCGGSAPWTEARRREEEIIVLSRGSRVCDLVVAG